MSKKKWFFEPNNNLARASRFLVHFFDVHCTSTTWNLLTRCFDEEFFFLFLNLDKAFENSTPGVTRLIWKTNWPMAQQQIEQRKSCSFSSACFDVASLVLSWILLVIIIIFLVLKVSSKLLRQLKWHYAITSGTYFTSTPITFFFEKLPYLLLNLFNCTSLVPRTFEHPHKCTLTRGL